MLKIDIYLKRGQGQTILLVEDDDTVLKATKNLLEYLDYRVLTARNGREALEVFEACEKQISLVLTDIIMPEMDGVKLFWALKNNGSDVPVMMMTACPLESRVFPIPDGISGCLQKPFGLLKISEAIAEALHLEETRELAIA